MRVLLDTGLPASLVEHSIPLLSLSSGANSLIYGTDQEVVVRAANEGFEAVAFLGRETLARIELLETVQEVGIALIVTNSDEPVQASDHFADLMDVIASNVKRRHIVLVLAADVRCWRIDEFLARTT